MTLSELWVELKRPATAVASALFVLSVVLGIVSNLYFYLESQRAGQVTYEADQVQVYDKSGVVPDAGGPSSGSPLTLLDRFGRPLNQNVFGGSLYVWNSGNANIDNNDIREPFRIELEGEAGFLQMTAVQFTNNNEDHFLVLPDGSIGWKYFDPHQGFKVQFLYESPVQRRVIVVGRAEGIDGIVDENAHREHRKELIPLFKADAFVNLVTMVVIPSVLYLTHIRNLPAARNFPRLFFVCFGLFGLMAILQMWLALYGLGSVPTFHPPF